MGEFGILLSTGVCAAMFSFRRTDNWLRRLLDRPRAFVTLASGALVIGFVPHLYTLAITIAYLLLAALFYPSVQGHVRMQGYGHTFRMGKASRNVVRILSRESSRKSAA